MVLVNPIGLGGREGPAPMEPVTRGELPEVDMGEPVDAERAYQSNLATEVRRVVEWRPEFLEHVRIRYGNAIHEDEPLRSAARSANQTGDSMVGDWPLIRAKALVIGGEEDGANFPDNVRRAAQALPNGEYHLIPNVGHNPHLESPEILNRELIRFLGS